jgi:hypothetical protein
VLFCFCAKKPSALQEVFIYKKGVNKMICCKCPNYLDPGRPGILGVCTAVNMPADAEDTCKFTGVFRKDAFEKAWGRRS